MATARTHEPVRVGAFLVRGFVVLTAALVLTSLGGAAIYAAPITLPALLAISVFSRERSWRYAAAIVAGLTMFEVAWALAWNLTDREPLAVVVGSLAGIGTGFAFGHARSYRGVD